MVCKFHHYSKATANCSVSIIGLNSLFFNILPPNSTYLLYILLFLCSTNFIKIVLLFPMERSFKNCL